MARLPLQNRVAIGFNPIRFSGLLGSNSFSGKDEFYVRFEDRAEALEQTAPGQGYQLAYNETLTSAFGALVAKYMNQTQDTGGTLTFEQLIDYFDSIVMIPYFKEREKAGIGVDVKTGKDALNSEMLGDFVSILDQATAATTRAMVDAKFEWGALTLDSIAARVESVKNKTVSRIEAREFALCAVHLEAENAKRHPFWKIFNPTHYKELRTIKALKEIATKTASMDLLLDEAVNGPDDLRILKDAVELAHGKAVSTERLANQNMTSSAERKAEISDIENSFKNLSEEEIKDELNDTILFDGDDLVADNGDKDFFRDNDQSVIENGDGVQNDEDDLDLKSALEDAFEANEERVMEEDLDSIRIRVDLNQSDLGDNPRSNELSEKLIEEPVKDDLNRTR